jgi:hypothetical protein
VILDVREDIRNGREPVSKIMAAVAQLQHGEWCQWQWFAFSSQRHVRRFGRGFSQVKRGNKASVGEGYHS